MKSSWLFFKKTLWDFRWTTFIYSVVSLFWVIMLAATFPTIQEQFTQFADLLDAYPQAMREAFNITTSSFSTIEGFIAVEYFSLMWIIILALLIFTTGANTIAGELDRNTAEFTYTLPVKRYTVVLAKLLANYLLAALMIALTIFGLGLAIFATDNPVHWVGIWAMFAVNLALAWFLLGITTLFSTWFDNRGKVYAAASFVLLGSYLLHILAAFSDKAEKVYVLSFFKYYGDAEKIMLTGDLEPTHLVVLVLVGFIALILALVRAESRDL